LFECLKFRRGGIKLERGNYALFFEPLTSSQSASPIRVDKEDFFDRGAPDLRRSTLKQRSFRKKTKQAAIVNRCSFTPATFADQAVIAIEKRGCCFLFSLVTGLARYIEIPALRRHGLAVDDLDAMTGHGRKSEA